MHLVALILIPLYGIKYLKGKMQRGEERRGEERRVIVKLFHKQVVEVMVIEGTIAGAKVGWLWTFPI